MPFGDAPRRWRKIAGGVFGVNAAFNGVPTLLHFVLSEWQWLAGRHFDLHAHEVESGSLKAAAVFRADKGDYVVTDAALLKALAAPGEHALVFTVLAGKDSDLLNGTMHIGAATPAADSHGHSHDDGHVDDHRLERAAWTGAAILGVGLVGLLTWLRQRKRGAVPAAKGVL